MITGSLPPAYIWGTWFENMEVINNDDGLPMDLTGLTEITLLLRSPLGSGFLSTGFNEITLKLTNGDITLPAPGIIEWRAEVTQMATLRTGLYEVIVIFQDGTDTLPLVVGTISIME